MVAHPMQQYHDLMRHTLEQGVRVLNERTGEHCYLIPSAQLMFNLQDGFPAISTKQLFYKSSFAELLGFFRGYTSAAEFRALGTNIWTANANSTPAWLANKHRKGEDDLGRLGYSTQWTAWRDTRVAHSIEERQSLLDAGFEERLHDPGKDLWMMERAINQIESVLRKLLTDPSDRRIVITGWRLDEFDQMALPPCHHTYTFTAIEATRELHLTVNMRSVDVFLGLSFNNSTAALFLSLMARLAGYKASSVTMQLANVHVYANHVDQVQLQLSRAHLKQPTLIISDEVKTIGDLSEIEGAFTRIEPHHLTLQDYIHHPAIRAPMAV